MLRTRTKGSAPPITKAKTLGKKGQVSETMTWVVATLIIVVVLSISVFLASLVGQNKTFPLNGKVDLLAKKSLTAYLLTPNVGIPVYEQIKNEGELNDFTGNLASKIFNNLHGGYNLYIFLGVRDYDRSTAYPNKYFSSPAIALGNAAVNPRFAVFYLINLDNNKLVQLVLWKTSQ